MSLRLPTRWLAALAAVAVAVVLLAADGPDLWADVDSGRAGSADAAAQVNALEARKRAIDGRMAYKQALVTDLADGRTSLADVAAEFLRLNREPPGALTLIRTTYPGLPDDEASARNVLDYVRLERPDDAPTHARLAADFERLFGHPPAK